MEQFFKDIDYEVGWYQYQNTAHLLGDFQAPNIEVQHNQVNYRRQFQRIRKVQRIMTLKYVHPMWGILVEIKSSITLLFYNEISSGALHLRIWH